jgi:hypothetical protein
MKAPKLLNYLRIGLRALFYILVFSTFVVWILGMYFGTTGPTSPIGAIGRIYPYNFHRKVVYLTRFEHFITGFGTWNLLLFLALAVGLLVKQLDAVQRRRTLPS